MVVSWCRGRACRGPSASERSRSGLLDMESLGLLHRVERRNGGRRSYPGRIVNDSCFAFERFLAASVATMLIRYGPAASLRLLMRPLNGTACAPEAPVRVSVATAVARTHDFACLSLGAGFTQDRPLRRPLLRRLIWSATRAGSERL